jgi:hypothetical protein
MCRAGKSETGKRFSEPGASKDVPGKDFLSRARAKMSREKIFWAGRGQTSPGKRFSEPVAAKMSREKIF